MFVTFPFKSDFKGHKIKHRNKTNKSFFSQHVNCGKDFMRNSELTAHAHTHCKNSPMQLLYLLKSGL